MFIRKTRLYFVLTALLLLFSGLLQAANITVQTGRNPVVLDEQFTLVFSADSNPAGAPDFTPLNQYFDLISQGKSSSVRVINGSVSQNVSWNLVLFPKQAGKITIPAISFGSDKSQPYVLEVSAKPIASQVGQDIILEVEVEPKTAYVQQQIVYIQRLYYARDFFDGADLSTPQPKAGKIDIEKLGSGRRYTTTKNGRQYKVIERRYAIFPVQSGKLEIAPTFFQGRFIDSGPRSNYGLFSQAGQKIRRYSSPVSIDVKPQAAAYKGQHWLPASNLTLHANWSTPPEQAKTGEPITLSLGMIANGLRAEQLPQLQVTLPAGLKAYNDQPVLNNESNSDEIVGTRQEKILVVASKPGDFSIPEITLSWWNSKTNSQQTATIPAQKFIATGAVAGSTIVQPPVTPLPLTSKVKPAEPSTISSSLSTELANTGLQTVSVEAKSTRDIWFYISQLLLLALVFVLYLLWKQSTRVGSGGIARSNLSASKARKNIRKANQSQDRKALREALLGWGDVYLQLPKSNLQNIADNVTDSTLKDEIQQLIKALYASDQSAWQSDRLCELVQQYKIPKISPKPPSRIASLYPE